MPNLLNPLLNNTNSEKSEVHLTTDFQLKVPSTIYCQPKQIANQIIENSNNSILIANSKTFATTNTIKTPLLRDIDNRSDTSPISEKQRSFEMSFKEKSSSKNVLLNEIFLFLYFITILK